MDVTLPRCIELVNENKHFFPRIISYDNPSCASSVLQRRGSFLLYLLRDFCIVSKIIAILPVIPGSEELNTAVLSLHYWLNICPGSHQVLLVEKGFMNFVYNVHNRKTAFQDLESFTNIVITSETLICLFFRHGPMLGFCWNTSTVS